MEWRQQTSVSCADAFNEAQRWIEEVTGKSFGCKDFRAALENGVLLCDLINQLKPGIIKRVNRLSTPIAGLDNVNVFLKACGKLGLNVSQLFHPGDLQDLSTRATLRKDESNRRLKNVLITIYWLGRKAHLDAFYSGPQLNFKAFEGLLGLALSKALDEGSNVFVKDGWYPERSDCLHRRRSCKLENSVDSMDSVDSKALHPNSEGCGSDPEAEQVFKMEATQSCTWQNKGCTPPPSLQRKQGVAVNGIGGISPLARVYDIQVRLENAQVNPGWIWSKSLSDIPMVYPVHKAPDGNIIYNVDQDTGISGEWHQENKNKCIVSAKDSEAHWQDDLTKWKNRRRSSKSDLHRRSQEREHVINQMINGAMPNSEKNETGGLFKRDQQSPHRNNPATCSSSTSPSKSSSADLQPRTRVLLARSFALELSFIPTAPVGSNNSAQTRATTAAAMPASDGNILGEETHYASLPSDKAGATTPTVDCPFTAQTQVKAQGGPTPPQPTSGLAQPNQISTLITTIQPIGITKSASTSSHKEPDFCTDPKAQTFCLTKAGVGTVKEHKNHKEKNQKTSLEPAVDQGISQQSLRVNKDMSRSGSWSSSASLPRGYRRSEGSICLSSAITARPFGTKQSRVSSLPRLCNVDDDQGLLLKGDKVEPLSSPIKSSLKRQTATAHLKGQNRPLTGQSANQAEQNVAPKAEEMNAVSLSSQTSFQTNGYLHQPFTQNQLLLQPYPFPQAHHSRTSSLPPNSSVEHVKLDHSDMRVSLTLKPNSRPDFGFQTHWDSTGVRVKFIRPGSPAELCQLRVDDVIMTVNGVVVEHMTYTQWKDKMTSSLKTGSLTMDIRRYGNKDWSTSEGVHHNQPGKSRKKLNLTAAAPALIGYPYHHANSGTSTETTVRKMSTINGQMDNVMRGKVMHGELAENHRTARSKGSDSVSVKNQRRRADFFRQKGGSESAISDLQMPSLSPSSFSWSWDHEEHRRRQEKWQEEQERLLQEQFQRDQERLDAEWQRAQQDAVGELCMESGQNTFDRTNGDECPASALPQKSKTGEKEQTHARDELKEPGSKHQSNGQGVQKDTPTETAWADDCGGFAQLSRAHRAKSMSTPALAAPQRPRGDERNRRHTLSKVEKERQQILEEMKKRTQLLTDNSWIRQRSSSFYKEPIYIGAPLKRFDSLDNLDTLRQSPPWTTTFSYPRPHSVAAGYCAPGRNPSSRCSAGGMLSQRNASMDPSNHCSVWAANHVSEELKLAPSGFGLETGSHTVSPAQTHVHSGLHETSMPFPR